MTVFLSIIMCLFWQFFFKKHIMQVVEKSGVRVEWPWAYIYPWFSVISTIIYKVVNSLENRVEVINQTKQNFCNSRYICCRSILNSLIQSYPQSSIQTKIHENQLIFRTSFNYIWIMVYSLNFWIFSYQFSKYIKMIENSDGDYFLVCRVSYKNVEKLKILTVCYWSHSTFFSTFLIFFLFLVFF